MTPAKRARKSVKKSGPKSGTTVALAKQPHGGAIRVGSAKGNTPGTGRPPDALRAAMRELGAAKGLPFLSDLLDGKITVDLLGVCAQCKAETKMDLTWVDDFVKKLTASVDQRLKANEQALKYGLGTKDEVTLVSPEIIARLGAQVAIIHDVLASHPELADRLLDRLGAEVWK